MKRQFEITVRADESFQTASEHFSMACFSGKVSLVIDLIGPDGIIDKHTIPGAKITEVWGEKPMHLRIFFDSYYLHLGREGLKSSKNQKVTLNIDGVELSANILEIDEISDQRHSHTFFSESGSFTYDGDKWEKNQPADVRIDTPTQVHHASRSMVEGLISKYKGTISILEGELELLLTNPVGIGEHTKLAEDIDEKIGLIADFQDKLGYLEAKAATF